MGSEPRNQFGGIGVPGSDGLATGFALAESLFTKNERHAVLLSDPAMTCYAVLIEDRPDVAAEISSSMGPSGKQRIEKRPTKPSNGNDAKRRSNASN
jgi:hypothetical protein